MICFNTDAGRFNFRSAAAVIHNEHVLIHQVAGDDFWALPGGRVELMEASDTTVTREMYEELGIRCEVVRQLWHVESFYEFDSKYYHELGNYFLVRLCETPVIESEIDFPGIEDCVDLVFRWVPLAALKQYNLQPAFLIAGLTDLPDGIESIRINEIDRQSAATL